MDTVARPYPPTAAEIDHLDRNELIDQLLRQNEVSTFQFSERFLRKQRLTRLRDLLRSTQDQPIESEFEPS